MNQMKEGQDIQKFLLFGSGMCIFVIVDTLLNNIALAIVY